MGLLPETDVEVVSTQDRISDGDRAAADLIIGIIQEATNNLGLGRDNIPSGEVGDTLLDVQQRLLMELSIGSLAVPAAR